MQDPVKFYPNSDKNKFGYYQVGEHCTYSKYDAVSLSRRTGKSVSWEFNTLSFSLFNWLIEPTESLQELYRRRAQQLRDKYDYLVLWYSGGADSHNIARTFLENNIPLDEIVMYVNTEGKSGVIKDSATNIEPLTVGVPFTEEFKRKQPGVIVRLFDTFPLVVEKAKDRQFTDNIPYYINYTGGPQHLVKPFVREHVTDYQRLIASGNQVAFIWGCDKPNVSCTNGKWEFYFSDVVDNSVRSLTQIKNNTEEHDELFYWSPDCPELIAKQVHTIKNFYSTQLGKKSLYQDKIMQTQLYSKFVSSWLTGEEFMSATIYGAAPTAAAIKRLIYPWWTPEFFSIGKSITGAIYGVRDTWLFNGNVEEVVDPYIRGLNRFSDEIGVPYTGMIKFHNVLTPYTALLNKASNDDGTFAGIPPMFQSIKYQFG